MVEAFEKNAKQDWWNEKGPFQSLHWINSVRLSFIVRHLQDYCRQSNQSFDNLRIFDIGCGGGILSEPLARLGAKVTGIDDDPVLIQVARSHATSNNLTIDYQEGGLDELLLMESNQFDCVILSEVIEHLSCPIEWVQKISDLLIPNGCFFLTAPNQTLLAYLVSIYASEFVLKLIPPQTHHYSQLVPLAQAIDFLKQSGIQILDVQGMRPKIASSFPPLFKLCASTNLHYLIFGRKEVGSHLSCPKSHRGEMEWG